jgi:hypothetical protein
MTAFIDDSEAKRASNNLFKAINIVLADTGVGVSIEQWPSFGVIWWGY